MKGENNGGKSFYWIIRQLCRLHRPLMAMFIWMANLLQFFFLFFRLFFFRLLFRLNVAGLITRLGRKHVRRNIFFILDSLFTATRFFFLFSRKTFKLLSVGDAAK